MKIIFYKLLILCIVSCLMVFIGCKTNDESLPNQISFNSTNYSISKGYQSPRDTIINALPKANVFEFDIILSGKGVSYDADNMIFTGQGDYLYISMYSLNSEFLAPGLYTFDRFSSGDSLTIDYGIFGINADFTFEIPENYLSVSCGVINVQKVGNSYQIDFDLYTDDNKQVVGTYSGILETVTLKEEFNPDPDSDPDIDPVDHNSYFNFQSINYPLVYGALDLFDQVAFDPSIFQYDLILTGPGITYDANIEDYVGKGNVIGISIYSTSPDSLKTGTYTFDGSDTNPFTFDFSVVILNYDISSETDDGNYIINSGTIQISRIDDEYQIVFDLVAGEDIPVKGQFYGTLDYHDFFFKKKAVHRPFNTKVLYNR